MSNLVKSYWTDAHKKYSENGFVLKPTMFSEEVLPHLPNQGVLLDIGAGQGQDSRFFAKHGFNVTSTDLTPHPLEVSKQLAGKENLNVTFIEVNVANNLPFDDSTFDVVYSHLALHYFDRETTKEVFSEINRVLKPSGIFATLLNTVEDPEIERNDFEKIEEDFYKIPAGIYKRFFSVESLKMFTEKYFEPIIMDAQGKTYKDEIETLIRFVGKKK
jgi:ubiquinone/menaquinone biosynthesis C-methylase UbiE